MKIYTGKGDRGVTGVNEQLRLPKSDERVSAVGDIDELVSHLDLIAAQYADSECVSLLSRVREVLLRASESVKLGEIGKCTVTLQDVSSLEADIDAASAGLGNPEALEVKGSNLLSAQLNVARAIARRAERSVCAVNKKSAVHPNLLKYMNRLSDFLLIAACHAESGKAAAGIKAKQPAPQNFNSEQDIVNAVLAQIAGAPLLTLDVAKKLIDVIVGYGKSVGKRVVVCVCNADGNPIAVEVMDGAFLVSFDVAVRKAYTAVAVQMPTIELAKIVQPGETFYGLQNMDKIMPLGGGVPLTVNGRMVGGLGVSGGTGEEDHAICEFALKAFEKLI